MRNKEKIIQVVVQDNNLVYLTNKGNVYGPNWDGKSYTWISPYNGSKYQSPIVKYTNITPELPTNPPSIQ